MRSLKIRKVILPNLDELWKLEFLVEQVLR